MSGGIRILESRILHENNLLIGELGIEMMLDDSELSYNYTMTVLFLLHPTEWSVYVQNKYYHTYVASSSTTATFLMSLRNNKKLRI